MGTDWEGPSVTPQRLTVFPQCAVTKYPWMWRISSSWDFIAAITIQTMTIRPYKTQLLDLQGDLQMWLCVWALMFMFGWSGWGVAEGARALLTCIGMFNPTRRGFLGFVSGRSPLSPTLSREPPPQQHLKLPAGSTFISPRNVHPSSPTRLHPIGTGSQWTACFWPRSAPPCPPPLCLLVAESER